MKRLWLALLAALVSWTSIMSAHEVPDRVQIGVFLKPEQGRMLMLVRMPANALIDFLLPTLEGGNWLDLANADAVAAEGASVWIADMLSIYENGAALPKPQLLAVRLSRTNDPSFATFQDALNRVKGAPLPADTLVLQEGVTVDALLEAPITSMHSRFSFEPRFARLGVVVDTSLTFLPSSGDVRQFQYQDDPDTFVLDPGLGHSVARFVRAGIAHYFSETDYLLMTLCVALVFRPSRGLLPFALALVAAESLALLGSLEMGSLQPGIRGVVGVLIAATTVYMGIEAIIGGDGKRVGPGIVAGLIAGCGFALGLQPMLQFGGAHTLASGLGFTLGIVSTQLVTLVLLLVAVQVVLTLSRVPRMAIIVASAVAIHISWRTMLERADALALVPLGVPVATPVLAAAIGAAMLSMLAMSAWVRRRQQHEGRSRQATH